MDSSELLDSLKVQALPLLPSPYIPFIYHFNPVRRCRCRMKRRYRESNRIVADRDFLPTISIIFKIWLVPASVFCHFSSFRDILCIPRCIVWIPEFREKKLRPFPRPTIPVERSFGGTKLIIKKKRRERSESRNRWRRRRSIMEKTRYSARLFPSFPLLEEGGFIAAGVKPILRQKLA